MIPSNYLVRGSTIGNPILTSSGLAGPHCLCYIQCSLRAGRESAPQAAHWGNFGPATLTLQHPQTCPPTTPGSILDLYRDAGRGPQQRLPLKGVSHFLTALFPLWKRAAQGICTPLQNDHDWICPQSTIPLPWNAPSDLAPRASCSLIPSNILCGIAQQSRSCPGGARRLLTCACKLAGVDPSAKHCASWEQG